MSEKEDLIETPIPHRLDIELPEKHRQRLVEARAAHPGASDDKLVLRALRNGLQQLAELHTLDEDEFLDRLSRGKQQL